MAVQCSAVLGGVFPLGLDPVLTILLTFRTGLYGY